MTEFTPHYEKFIQHLIRACSVAFKGNALCTDASLPLNSGTGRNTGTGLAKGSFPV